MGLPQVRKFYVFCELVVVFSALRSMRLVRWLILTWAGFAAITAARGAVTACCGFEARDDRPEPAEAAQ